MKTPIYAYLEDLAQAPALHFSSRCTGLQTNRFEVGYFYKKAAAPFELSPPQAPPQRNPQPANSHFQLYPHSQLVLGQPHALLCQVQRGYWRAIPNLLAEVLQRNQGQSIQATKAAFHHELDAGIDRYFQHLQQEGWGFFSDGLSGWTSIAWNWDYPGALTNAILERDVHSNYPLSEAITELLALGIGQLQLWLRQADWEAVHTVLDSLKNSALRQIEIYLPHSAEGLRKGYDLLVQHTRLQELHFFQAPKQVALFTENPALRGRAWSHSTPFPNKQELERPFFWCNLPAYAEAKQALVGLNRLLSIDAWGGVKRFPSHEQRLGYFPERSLSAIWAEQEPLPSVEEIEPCGQCSYRYICQSKQLPYLKEGRWWRDCSVPDGHA